MVLQLGSSSWPERAEIYFKTLPMVSKQWGAGGAPFLSQQVSVLSASILPYTWAPSSRSVRTRAAGLGLAKW